MLSNYSQPSGAISLLSRQRGYPAEVTIGTQALHKKDYASKRALSNDRDIEMFAKPKPKKAVALKKSPLPLRANVSSKAAKKPRKKIARKKKAKR